MSRIPVALIAALSVALLALWVHASQLSVQLTNATEENAALRMSIERTTAALEGYQEDHQRDTQTLTDLDRQIKELEAYVSALPDAADQCLSAADADRLRALWP